MFSIAEIEGQDRVAHHLWFFMGNPWPLAYVYNHQSFSFGTRRGVWVSHTAPSGLAFDPSYQGSSFRVLYQPGSARCVGATLLVTREA